jgi:hypothetical protein
MARKYHQGLFKPTKPERYVGDSKNIVFRSSWEKKFMSYLDKHPDVISWASEEMFIPYVSPIDNRVHRYFPDFIVKKKNAKGIVEVLIVEIKPKHQTKPPNINTKRNKKTVINEAMTYQVNQAKWKAAEQFCLDRNYKFIILTEDQLGING